MPRTLGDSRADSARSLQKLKISTVQRGCLPSCVSVISITACSTYVSQGRTVGGFRDISGLSRRVVVTVVELAFSCAAPSVANRHKKNGTNGVAFMFDRLGEYRQHLLRGNIQPQYDHSTVPATSFRSCSNYDCLSRRFSPIAFGRGEELPGHRAA